MITTPIIIIIGAGLTGLTLGYELARAGQEFRILEARPRTGGRIFSASTPSGGPIEMGATWLGTKHTALTGLLEKLGIPTFEQTTGGRAIYEAISTSPAQVVQLPHNDQPSYRIAGGTERLLEVLKAEIPDDWLLLDTPVKALERVSDGVTVVTDAGNFHARQVVSTLPPHLFFTSITRKPELAEDLVNLAAATHTWMGESIKVGLRYDRPFWRTDGPGGTIFSNVGPVTEMYDHSSVNDDHYALKGFFNGSFYPLSREQRREMVLDQLRKYYGPEVDDYREYAECVWRNEAYTFTPNPDHVLPHQNNGAPAFRKPYWGGRLLLAGSETAAQFPGYMDGAVRSGQRVAAQLLMKVNTQDRV